MNEAIAFDTHRFVKRLTESGFTEKQAETLAEEHVALLNTNLATKADIARVEAGVDVLRQETRAAIEAVKVDLLKWLFGALIAQGGLIVARKRSGPGGRNMRGRYPNDAVPREAATFRPFSPAWHRAHPPSVERLPTGIPNEPSRKRTSGSAPSEKIGNAPSIGRITTGRDQVRVSMPTSG